MSRIPDFKIINGIRRFKEERSKAPVLVIIETPSYSSPEVEKQTIRSNNLIWALTQIRKVTIKEDKNNIFTEKQKLNAQLLTSLTGNGVVTDSSGKPPYQTGSFMLVFDDFTSIVFNTGFKSNYGFGVYKYTGLVNNIKNFTTCRIYWRALSSGAKGSDKWELYFD